MTASELTHGKLFKTSKAQRKWRTVNNVTILTEGKYIGPKEHLNHALIVFDGCNQMLLPKDFEVIIPN